jgi:hypothetical protein
MNKEDHIKNLEESIEGSTLTCFICLDKLQKIPSSNLAHFAYSKGWRFDEGKDGDCGGICPECLKIPISD